MGTQVSSKSLAVVTGASSGIGLELAKQFAEHGFDLVIAAEDPAIQAAAQTLQAMGAEVQAHQVDLATYDGVERLAAAVEIASRPVDVLALNAGVGVYGDFTRETSLKDELKLIDLNVVSTVHLAKRVAKQMVARGSGRIVITSSIAAMMPAPLEAVYGASKAFLLSFAESLRHELKDTGVTVTAIAPGPTDTNFFHRAGMEDTKAGTVEKEKNPASEVARQGFEAVMAGKERVVTGNFMTKLQGAVSKIMPEDMKAAQHLSMTKPGSAPTPKS